MKGRPLDDRITWVGAVDWERRIFDDLVPLPEGTSYNSYLVRGSEKTALMDAVDPQHTDTLLARLEGEGVRRIDYVISHHAEQDHSGGIPAVLARYPEAQVLATEKGKSLLMDHLGLPAEKVTTVRDGERLSLGDLTLEMIHFPWVHWPETMMTWLPERRVLFSCDLFGSHVASSRLRAGNDSDVLVAAKRYYAEIMMPYRSTIERNLPKVTSRDVALIAPSHGPVHDDPAGILGAYRGWIAPATANLVVVPYVSMHDSTRRMVEHLVEACAERGVVAEAFNLTGSDVGRLAMLLVDASTIVFATPTVLAGAHPHVAAAAYLINLIRPKTRFLSVMGSFGWGGKVVEQMGELMPNLKTELLPAVLCKGQPKAGDLEAIDRLADQIAERHRAASA